MAMTAFTIIKEFIVRSQKWTVPKRKTIVVKTIKRTIKEPATDPVMNRTRIQTIPRERPMLRAVSSKKIK
jgi:hypothetical protein